MEARGVLGGDEREDELACVDAVGIHVVEVSEDAFVFLLAEFLAVRAESEEHLGLVVAGLLALEGRRGESPAGVERGDRAGPDVFRGNASEQGRDGILKRRFPVERLHAGLDQSLVDLPETAAQPGVNGVLFLVQVLLRQGVDLVRGEGVSGAVAVRDMVQAAVKGRDELVRAGSPLHVGFPAGTDEEERVVVVLAPDRFVAVGSLKEIDVGGDDPAGIGDLLAMDLRCAEVEQGREDAEGGPGFGTAAAGEEREDEPRSRELLDLAVAVQEVALPEDERIEPAGGVHVVPGEDLVFVVGQELEPGLRIGSGVCAVAVGGQGGGELGITAMDPVQERIAITVRLCPEKCRLDGICAVCLFLKELCQRVDRADGSVELRTGFPAGAEEREERG